MKVLLKHFLITSVAYLCSYVIYSFTTWTIINPFQWIINIPREDDPYRFFIIIFGTIWIIGLTIILLGIEKENNN